MVALEGGAVSYERGNPVLGGLLAGAVRVLRQPQFGLGSIGLIEG